jgi:antitoxin YefM
MIADPDPGILRRDGLGFWSMTTLPLSEAKARLSQIAEEVHRTHERVTITKNGRSYLVLMSAEDLESIEATLELLADAEAVRRVEQGREDLAAGLGTSAEDMAELMAARRETGGA